MLHERCGIVLVGDAPRALARAHARLSGYPTVVLGAAVVPGVPNAPTLTDALRALDAQRVLVVEETVELDGRAAAALLALVTPATLLAPLLVDRTGAVAYAGSVALADPARGRANVVACGGGIDAAATLAVPPRALDGRCIAATAGTLLRYAPKSASRWDWAAATARAARDGVTLALAGDVRVPLTPPVLPPFGDDPRDAARESALAASADPEWTAYAIDAAHGVVRRDVRTPLGIDVRVAEPAPRATVVVIGEDGDREGLERGLRGATAVERIVTVAAGGVQTAREALRNRGDRYVAFVDARSRLEEGWLDAACAALERDALAAAVTSARDGADARATVFSAARIPSAAQLDGETVHGAVGGFIMRLGREYRLGLRRLDPPLAHLPPPAGEADADVAPVATAPRFSGIASIVMLSWNAPEFTKLAVESIRAVTKYPYEIIVVDNGSEPPTRRVLQELARDHGIRVIHNERNLGFGMGMNVGIAAARGDVVVLLNNDVIVGDGWLETMVGALESRRRVGLTAPRSNKVAGPQILGVPYADPSQMGAFVAQRRVQHAQEGFWLDRVIGFCMCFDRRVLDDVGGFDPLYGIGNFEDDDLCIRVRAAGWGVFVCDDAFIHHFGHASFVANKIDYRGLMEANWRAFTAKWELGDTPLGTPYNSRAVHRRGFERERHYVAPDASA